MAGLLEAMALYATHIVLAEHRPFCARDFGIFEVGGVTYAPDYGTVRNYMQKLKEQGDIVPCYKSGVAYYSVPGYPFSKRTMMTGQLTEGGSSRSVGMIAKLVSSMPFQQRALHDIHLQFPWKGIWSLLQRQPDLHPHPENKGIMWMKRKIGELEIKVTAHPTDSLSAVVACTHNPVAADAFGFVRLSAALARVEERMAMLAEQYSTAQTVAAEPRIPISAPVPFPDWAVTQWHWGTDSVGTYSGEMFEVAYNDLQAGFMRIYTKRLGKKVRLRIECQENPDKALKEAMMEKLGYSGGEEIESSSKIEPSDY